jgi:flavin reductase (DIM6/NTAB) family NADH-FMN oxidoreductase RutF
MNLDEKKTALRMIPYGLYILTAQNKDAKVAAATVSWMTQASFKPALLVVAVKVGSYIHEIILETKTFAINVLGKGQNEIAFSFFKSVEREGQTIAGQPFHAGETGAPILETTPAYIECRLVDSVDKGDHSVFIAEVVTTGLNKQIVGRPDLATLWLPDLGENIFYGG